jgi:putative spermidine/putrescine transport system ATP-binding protein
MQYKPVSDDDASGGRPNSEVAMAKVEFRGVGKSYGSVAALAEVNLSIAAGEFVTLLGPSGSGKTTLLNIVSGMTVPSGGAVLIDGQDITRLPPRTRGLGMVFQNYALMPHMTVFDNIAFPLRVRKVPRHEIRRRVKDVLAVVRLAEMSGRKPKELSGGQQQRVSIARCLVYQPKLILMDEPLGALDKKLREQLQLELKKIHRELGVTVLYVTHDQEEALVLSDRICVMQNGRIEQIGTPDELYFRPKTRFVADFLGESNLIPATIADVRDGIATVRTDDGTAVRARAEGSRLAGKVDLLVRPESIHIERAGRAGGHGLRGVIRERIFVGKATRYSIASGQLRLVAQLKSGSQAPHFMEGEEVWLHWSETDSFIVAHHL